MGVFVVGFFRVELSGPFFDFSIELAEGTTAKFAAGAVAGPGLWEGEVLEEFREGAVVDFGGFDEGAAWVGNAVDTTVFVIAERVAGAVLHVADENVVPVAEVEGAIWPKLVIDGAEIAVGRFEEVVAMLGFVAGFGIKDLVLFEAKKADGVS